MSAEIRDRALEIAIGELGVREVGGANRGVDVEKYLHAVGLPSGHAWCAAFVAWCYAKAAKDSGLFSPIPRTGKVIRMWRKSPKHWKGAATVGAIFFHATDPDDPESKGHCGIVTEVGADHVLTIEGNTSQKGSREGDGVYRQRRSLSYVNLGFADIARPVESHR